jgi:uncharacterized delta-60 repeat protein
MKSNFTMIMAVLFALISRVSGQNAGTLDLTFNGTGKVIYDRDQFDLYNNVKVQPDGKIVAVGSSMSPSYSPIVIEVTRYLPDGTFDPSFGTNGHYTYSDYVESGAYKCMIKSDGKILIGGYTTNYSTYWMLLIQLNADGTLDPTFGTNGIVLQPLGPQENNIFALAFQGDGKILAAGYSQDENYNHIPVVLRFSETGVLDVTFGTNGVATIPVTEVDNEFSALSVQSDGKIVAAGHISNGLSWFSLLAVRFDQNGALDPTYGTAGIVNINLGNVDDEFFDMVMLDDDETILTGFVVSQTDFSFHMLLMKLDNSGSPALGFGLDGYQILGDVPYTVGNALALQPDGKILVVGSTGELQPGNNDWVLWRFNADGNLDDTFGTNGVTTTDFFGNAEEALGITLYQNKIIVAGKTRNAINFLDFAIAEYNNDNYFNVSIPDANKKADFVVSPNPIKQNTTARLDFELKQSSEIAIEMVNITGTSVFQFSLGKQNAGKLSYQFNLPSTITSGVYILKVKDSQSILMTQKIVVLKW